MEHKLFSILNEILYWGLDNTQVTTLDGDQDTTPYFGTKENIHLHGKHVAFGIKRMTSHSESPQIMFSN